jgi:hypothetical protein
MSPKTAETLGTLRADGTLALDQAPNLPPGRVRVILQAIPDSAASGEDWWQYLRRARQELEGMGYPFFNEEGVSAWIEELRADDDRIERAYHQAENTRPSGG